MEEREIMETSINEIAKMLIGLRKNIELKITKGEK